MNLNDECEEYDICRGTKSAATNVPLCGVGMPIVWLIYVCTPRHKYTQYQKKKTQSASVFYLSAWCLKLLLSGGSGPLSRSDLCSCEYSEYS